MDKKDKIQLGNVAKKWLKTAYRDSARQSAKIVRKEARSLARSEEVKNQLQYGRVDELLVLHYAITKGHKLLFTLLLEEFNIDPNLPDSFNGRTALHHAAAAGQKELLKILLTKYMCNTEAPDRGNSTPVFYSIAFAQSPSLHQLLKVGASVHVEGFLGMPMHYAIHAGNFGAVGMLHKSSPDVVNAEIYGFCTPLVAAAFYDSDESFKYLAEVAGINAKPLMYKIICCADDEDQSLKRVKILLDREVNANLFDQDILREELPIVCAAKRGFKKVVEALLDHTSKIPEVHWSVPGVLDYVNSEQYKGVSRVERESRVELLKQRLIEELEANHYLAADIICKNDHAGALQAAKACMALAPKRKLCLDFYRDVTENNV